MSIIPTIFQVSRATLVSKKMFKIFGNRVLMKQSSVGCSFLCMAFDLQEDKVSAQPPRLQGACLTLLNQIPRVACIEGDDFAGSYNSLSV
jgi:hypothetical protein